MTFADRREAGRLLAERLEKYAGQSDLIVLGLPRGGVPVAYEVAKRLDAPLDVYVVRKLGVPGHEELAMGAIAPGGVRVLHDEVVAALRIPPAIIDEVARREERELDRRQRAYRGDAPPPTIEGHTVILVDDGVATGSTMRAAAAAVRQQSPARVVVAVPIAAASTCDELDGNVDETVCLSTPESFMAVGMWYDDFSQTSDDEVRALLEASARLHSVS